MKFETVYKAINLPLNEFCFLFGIPYHRAWHWLKGVNDCPSYVVILIARYALAIGYDNDTLRFIAKNGPVL